MKTFLETISEEMGKAFEAAGYDSGLGKVTVSNRPDLCEYQCNGAMAGAKQYHKAPIMIAEEVAAAFADSPVFAKVEAVKPGFLNLTIRESFISDYLNEMREAKKFGLEHPEVPVFAPTEAQVGSTRRCRSASSWTTAGRISQSLCM